MKKVTLLFPLILPLLWACNQTANSNLRPATKTSHAVTANVNLGVEYMQRGDFEKALEKLDRARQIDPGYFGTYNIYGLLFQRLGKMKQAERNFRKAISLGNNDPGTLNNYGQFLCETGKADEAEQTFALAVKNPLYKTPEIALTNAGLCALLNGHEEDAEKYLRRALESNPKIPKALLKMAQISYDKKNYLSGRAYLQRYLELADHTAETLWLGIRIEKQLGDENAVSSYALLLKNSFPDSKENEMLQAAGTR
ncbi:MAG: type IV pilus biogenesis/stability protein PilW [Gammaproteobacteria bacterium]